MGDTKIRKQVYELTLADLERFPVWEFALDEEREEGQDEATVRPLLDQDVVYNGDVARATFVAADGTEFVGFVTPDPDRNPGWLQPTVVTAGGHVNFWFGWQEDGVTDDMVQPLYERLGMAPGTLFPISYRVDLTWEGGAQSTTFDGQVTGFGWLPEIGSDEVQERK